MRIERGKFVPKETSPYNFQRCDQVEKRSERESKPPFFSTYHWVVGVMVNVAKLRDSILETLLC